MKIDILGSCVTRDAARYSAEYQVNRYYARSSLISIYSDSTEIDIKEIGLASDF